MGADDLSLRVSVATLDSVVFRHPHTGMAMLALERKATLLENVDGNKVYVRAQPFGGAVRLLNAAALRAVIGDFQFDSERSRTEQDFRILIQPAAWPALREFCIQHLRRANDPVLETEPTRELSEEFAECLHVKLNPTQFVYQPVGLVVENKPTPTDNIHSRGVPTVRIYSVYEVTITDGTLCLALLAASDRYSDSALGEIALNNAKITGRGRANSVLTLPLDRITTAFDAMTPQRPSGSTMVDGHQLDRTVSAILDGVDLPHWQRLK